MLDITLLRRDLPQVIARLETRKSPQTFLNVEEFKTLENERKTLQTRCERCALEHNIHFETHTNSCVYSYLPHCR